MNTRHLWTATLIALAAGNVIAGVSADEAKALGTTLTATGAERAGNADKTIPEYTGGLTTPPAGYVKGSRHPCRPVRSGQAAVFDQGRGPRRSTKAS